MNKIITITGSDLCGKETQSKIIAHLIEKKYGHCSRFSFPRYTTAIGKLMGAMLDNNPFIMAGPKPLREGNFFDAITKKDQGYAYQCLAVATMFEAQHELGDALTKGHVVCDRYEVDSLAYGVEDCEGNIDWLEDMISALKYRSSVVITLINNGARLERPGETPDYNERRVSFSNRVKENFRALASLKGWHLIEIDQLFAENKVDSIVNVTKAIVGYLNKEGFELTFDQDDYEFVKQLVER